MRPPRRSHRQQQGFTLLEVLVCVVILSGALIFLYRPLLSGVNAWRYAEEREEASRFLDEQIWVLRERNFSRMGVLAPSETRTLLGRDRPFEYRRSARTLSENGDFYEIESQLSWTRAGTTKRLIRSLDAYVPQRTGQ